MSRLWHFWCGAWFAYDVQLLIRHANEGHAWRAIAVTVAAALMAWLSYSDGRK